MRKTIVLLTLTIGTAFLSVRSVPEALAGQSEPASSRVQAGAALPDLHRAVIAGDVEVVSQLIEAGADVNELDPKMGNAPLHIAAQSDHADIVRALIDNGAFVNLLTPRAGHSPLMVAAWYAKPDNVRVLLTAPDIHVSLQSPHGGATARDMIGGGRPPGSDKARALNAEVTEMLDAYEAELERAQSAQTIYTVVTDPALSASDRAARVADLIEEGADVNTVSAITGTANDRHSPLLVAARDGQAEVVEALLDGGADLAQRGYMMDSVTLHKAAYMGYADVLRRLLAHPDTPSVLNDIGPNNGYTPLHDAIWHGNVEAARALLDAGARTDIRSYEGDTARDLALRYDFDEIVALFASE